MLSGECKIHFVCVPTDKALLRRHKMVQVYRYEYTKDDETHIEANVNGSNHFTRSLDLQMQGLDSEEVFALSGTDSKFLINWNSLI